MIVAIGFGLTLATIAILFVCLVNALERLTRANDVRIDRLVGFHDKQREEWAKERRSLLANFGTERLAWERERGVLLNRIKPETKQYIPIALGDAPHTPAPLPYDDDEAFFKELEERETREELAQRLYQEEVNGRTG